MFQMSNFLQIPSGANGMSEFLLKSRKECPLCRSRKNSVYINFDEIPVVKCVECGFIYSSKIMSRKILMSYYENNFGSERHLKGQIVNAKINFLILKSILNIRNINSVLDVGTGYGFFLKEFITSNNSKVAGVEISHTEASYAKSTLHLNVLNSQLNKSGFDKESFDLVTSFEVIEHVPYPIEFISQMLKYVRPNGYLLIMTDNFGSRMAKLLGAGFPKWIPHSHISHFTSQTLRRVLEENLKLKVVKSVSYSPWEITARAAYYDVLNIKKSPQQAFDLRATLKSEMKGRYRLFLLRKIINRVWAMLTLKDDMEGDLIYYLVRKNK
jgi:2-polyprenyl-3-methyl-5-hydroxy-6-metoxy-1,4-benzoquinol methylase